MNPSGYYSQHDEEPVIVGHFAGRRGRFLEVGAHDGALNSNTLRLVEQGWGGVYVEPSPKPLVALIERHGGNPDLSIVQAAVAPVGGLLPWWDSRGDQVSTAQAAHAGHWAKWWGTNFQRMHVAAVTPAQLLDAVGVDFEFLVIDVEGGNAELVAAFPLERMPKLELLCVEKQKGHDIEGGLAARGWRQLHETPENLIMRRAS